MQSAQINVSSSGPNVIVPADPSGRKVRVVAFVLTFSAAVNATWQSAATPTSLGGPYYGATGGAVEAAPMPCDVAGGQQGHFDTLGGEALSLNLSAGVAVGGHVTYLLTR